VSSNAAAAGVASVPGPLTEMNWDGWLWYQSWAIRAFTATHADGVNAQSMLFDYEIDSKAMRKNFGPEHVIVGVHEFVETGTSTIRFDADTRILLKN